jgi:hypothetical protein
MRGGCTSVREEAGEDARVLDLLGYVSTRQSTRRDPKGEEYGGREGGGTTAEERVRL